MTTDRVSLEEAVKKDDMRYQLEAIRDYIAHQLEANLCKSCLNSRLRTGDQASLILRLTKVLEDIEALPDENEEVSRYDELLSRRNARVRGPGPSDPVESNELGTKHGERRQGGRRSRVNGGPESGSVAEAVSRPRLGDQA